MRQLREKSHRVTLGAIGNCIFEIGGEKERCVARPALMRGVAGCFFSPGGIGDCRFEIADGKRQWLVASDSWREKQKRDSSDTI